MYNNINLNNLKYFIEVADTKNITKASNNLNVSQPALTRAIKLLEEEINAKLLDRSKKGVTLTKEGEILYEYSKEMLKKLNSTINTINDSSISETHLYIGATTTNFLEPILDVLDNLRKKYPDIQIHLFLEEINVLENYNKLGKLDIIIKNNYEYFQDISIIKSFSIEDKFIASSKEFGHLQDKILSINEILTYPMVLLSNITHGRRNFDTYLKSLGITYKPNYEFNSYSLCRELIRNGFGIGIGNPIHYKDKKFIILNTDFNLPKRTFDICYIKSSKNKYIQDFINMLK